jgi:hypothetical protein
MDRDNLSAGTLEKGTRKGTTFGSSESQDPPSSSASRITPARRTGGLSSSSPLVEHTRRVAMEAQAYRTMVRLQDLEGSTRNDAVTGDGEEGDLPYEVQSPVGEASPSLFQAGSAFPGTAARQNVTVHRSRDRLSDRPVVAARSPEVFTSRRPSKRERDKRYSLESGLEMSFRGANAIIHS